jgi:hypothetical protein
MRLDAEEQVIGAAIKRAKFEMGNERAVWARIEFAREGHARVTLAISRELVEKTRALDWSNGELFAEAIRIALPGAFNIEMVGKAPPKRPQPAT